jgi:hypothetical protein
VISEARRRKRLISEARRRKDSAPHFRGAEKEGMRQYGPKKTDRLVS